MPRRRAVVAGVLFAALGASSSAQPPQSLDTDLVDLDVVVTDKQGLPVTGLRREDFDVREDGKRVEVATLTHVDASAPGADGRSLTILLDDVWMPRESVEAVRALATYTVMQARPADDVSVIRFTREDEPFGDRRAALARIADYRGAPARFAPAGSPEDVLHRLTGVANQLESSGRRRKILVCIGVPRICNVSQPGGFAFGWFYTDWRDAVAALARANLSVYSVLAMPAAVSGRGIVEATGGMAFHGAKDFRPVLDRLWQHAGEHYLLGYWPPASSKDVHAITVKVARKDVTVLARRQRGN